MWIKPEHRTKGGEKPTEEAHLLPPTGVADDCTVSVSQLPELEVDYRQKVVTLTCSFSTVGCPAEKPTRLWFRYGTHEPENLCSNGCSSETDKYTLKYPAQNQVSLTVNRLTFNDSAIYICGIAFRSSKQPRAKQTGGGTVLVVRGQSKLYSHTLCSAWPLKCITYFYAEIRR